MKFLLILLFLSSFLFACTKSKSDIKQTCYKGRYIDSGCWSVVQLLEPLDERLPTAQYRTYVHAFGTGAIPKQYKNGQPFYFTVIHIDSNVIHTDECIPTKYVVEIGSFSDSACSQASN